MSFIALHEKKIVDLVSESYTSASVLFHFGIRFYEYKDQTLKEVCNKLGLKVEQVVSELEGISDLKPDTIQFKDYPIELIVEYLKHAHFVFIKHKLPFVAKLIENFPLSHKGYEQIAKDLKMVFPLFVEDFINHIYEEEDTLFNYILKLENASKKLINPSTLWYRLDKLSLQHFAIEHEMHDDEMRGIRKITSDYHILPDAPLLIKVIYEELRDFEKQLKNHASIENDILFPRAMTLEAKVKDMLFGNSRWN